MTSLSPPEDFAADVEDGLGVGVVFAEDEGLRDEAAAVRGDELLEWKARSLRRIRYGKARPLLRI